MAQALTGKEAKTCTLGRRTQADYTGYDTPVVRATAFVPSARDLQIVDSTLSVFGGDVHNHYYPSESLKDVWAILRSIPNFRKIYQDLLSKATSGTGMWLLRNSSFRLWLEPNGDITIFWGLGIPGAGKTLLASIVIEHLEALRRASGTDICVCYIFFRYSERAEVKVRHILEVFVKQTLERHPEYHALIEQTYAQHLREGTEPTEAQLLGLLRQLIGDMAGTFYVLDALDEAPTDIQLAVVKALASLEVKLFITSRPVKTVEAHFPEAHTFPIIAQDDDIDLHIDKVLNESADLHDLLRREGPSLRAEIVSSIKQACGGMFLHASLQLDALRGCLSTRDVRDTFKAFPPSIDGVYRRTWARISNQSNSHGAIAKHVLVWVLNASRSMTLEELERAIATSPVTYNFEPDRRVPGTTLMSICRGLVVVEEESQLVRLVHYTAKETLTQLLNEAYPYPHSLLAAVCITHLMECGFQNSSISSEEELTTALGKDPLLAYASDAWAVHARKSLNVEDGQRRAARFIAETSALPAFTSTDHPPYFDILTPLHIVGLYNLPLTFIKDIAINDPNVTTKVHRQSPLLVASRSGHEDLIAHLLTLTDILVNLTDASGWSALMLAAFAGHEGVVKLLLAHPKTLVNLSDYGGRSALMLAAENGRVGVVTLLLAHPEIQINLVGKDGWSALMVAAGNGFEGVVTLLLAHPGIQANLVNHRGSTALVLAADAGHEDVVTLLLADVRVRVNLGDEDGWSALMLAARNGYAGVVRLLLFHRDVQVNLVNNYGESALMLAAKQGCEDVVRHLVTFAQIKVNLVNNNGWSALMLAAYAGHIGVVKLLIGCSGIQVNLVDIGGWSALMSAASEGHEGITKILLAYPGIEANLVKNDGCSALMLAARYGHEGIIELLLTYPGIHANLVTTEGWSALLWAASEGHEGAVKLLLVNSSIPVNMVDNTGWSALMLAASEGNEGVVDLFLAHPGVQVNQTNNDGWSALLSAAHEGHEGIMKILLAYPGIDVNLVDNKGQSALMVAARLGHEGIMKILLVYPRTDVNLVDNKGQSALMVAARLGHEGAVKLLLMFTGIHVNLIDTAGWSALIWAASEGQEGAVKLLLAYRRIEVEPQTGHRPTEALLAAANDDPNVPLTAVAQVDVNASTKDGDTAIKIAAERGDEVMVRLLLEVPNIDVGIRSAKDGLTAMSGAQAKGYVGIVELLRDFESRKALMANLPETSQSSLDDNAEGDRFDSEVYYDAEEGIDMDVDSIAASII